MPEAHKNSMTLNVSAPAAAAAVAQDTVVGSVDIGGAVTEVAVTSEAAVTANGTNFRTLRLVNRGQSGAGTTVVASLALDTPGTDDLTAYDEKIIPITGTATVASGDVLVLDETVTGTGLAHSGLRVRVLVER